MRLGVLVRDIPNRPVLDDIANAPCRTSAAKGNGYDLHQRAGSTTVVHLHPEIPRGLSSVAEGLLDRPGAGGIGDCCARGSQLRPGVVWFSESILRLGEARKVLATADTLLAVGTAFTVFPAVAIVDAAPSESRRRVANPSMLKRLRARRCDEVALPAVRGVPMVIASLGLVAQGAVS